MSELQYMATQVAYHLSSGAVARASYNIPETQDDADFVRKLVAEATTGRATIRVDSIDSRRFVEAEIYPGQIEAFLINPPS